MRYSQHLDYSKRKRFLRWISIFFGLFVIAALAGVLYVYRDNLISSNFNSDEQTISTPTSSYVAPSVQIFRSPFFQFQAEKSWSEDPSSSNAKSGKYAYKSIKNGLIEHQLTIYVNNPPEKQRSTRVLVATPASGGRLSVQKISEHCGKAFNFRDSSRVVVVDGVTFDCFADDTRYSVLVGLANGTTNMSLGRPDGSQASYVIYYSNVTATPDSSQLDEIVKSFQTR